MLCVLWLCLYHFLSSNLLSDLSLLCVLNLSKYFSLWYMSPANWNLIIYLPFNSFSLVILRSLIPNFRRIASSTLRAFNTNTNNASTIFMVKTWNHNKQKLCMDPVAPNFCLVLNFYCFVCCFRWGSVTNIIHIVIFYVNKVKPVLKKWTCIGSRSNMRMFGWKCRYKRNPQSGFRDKKIC